MMKVINAIWDEINTGLKTCEIVFEKNDTYQTYLDAYIEKDFRLSTVKVPAGNLILVHQMEENGYRYLENQIQISFDNSQTDYLNRSWLRLLNGFICHPVTTSGELDLIVEEVSRKMFETDRYSLDPCFSGTDVPSKRYISWMRDLFTKGNALFFTIERQGTPTGFFSMKQESESSCSCPIAGIYNRYKSAGYIFVLTWFWMLKSKELGARKLITSVSSNNRQILSSLSKVFSFRIDEIKIVLRKFIDPASIG